jgi:predicted TIM-barrel fold metal-dependent hydrolase
LGGILRRRTLFSTLCWDRAGFGYAQRAFLIKYQDRILYATDLVVLPKGDTDKVLAEWNNTYERDWKFFATVQTVEYKGHRYQGLALPELVLRKIFHDNAVHWLPGIMGKP